MFRKWLEQNVISKEMFQTPLFPKADDREFWGKALNEDLVKHAEKYLGYEWPLIRASQFMEFQKSGDRVAQETPHFDRRQALLVLLLGELKEHKGRFLPELCDGIFLVCEESFWGLSAHINAVKRYYLPDSANHYIDLFAAETAELLAVIYHIMYDEIKEYCPELLERMEYELDQRIVRTYLAHTDFWWMGNADRKVNNWNPWVISNILTVFLTVRPDSDLFEKGLHKMLSEINHYYEAMPDDGGCDEGCHYWAVAGAKLFSFCDQLYIASNGKVDFFGDRKLHNILHYEIKAYIGNSYFVNYGDGNAKIGGSEIPNLVYALYGFGLRTNSPEFLKFAVYLKQAAKNDDQRVSKGSSAKSILSSLIFAKDMAAQPEYKAEGSYVLPDLQHSYIRNGEWFCATKGGHNDESHNHNDVGNFMVYHNAEPVIVDAGCGVYTKCTFSADRYTIWTMQSGYHNLPILNGCEQEKGGMHSADRFAFNDNTTEVSFANAYTENAGILSVARRVTVTDIGITVQDDFTFNAETNTFEEHFMSVLEPSVNASGIELGGKYLLETKLPAKVEWVDFKGDERLMAAWGTEGIYRIILSAECSKTATFKTEIRRL